MRARLRVAGIRAPRDDDGPGAGQEIVAHVKEADAPRRAHPFVAARDVVRRVEGREVERDLAGGVGTVHADDDSAGGKLGENGGKGVNQRGAGRDVVDEGEARARCHGCENTSEDIGRGTGEKGDVRGFDDGLVAGCDRGEEGEGRSVGVRGSQELIARGEVHGVQDRVHGMCSAGHDSEVGGRAVEESGEGGFRGV